MYALLASPTIQLNNPKASGSKKSAPQSRHATTIIEFLLIYSSKMTLRPTVPSPHSSSGDFTSILQFQPVRPCGLAAHSRTDRQTDRQTSR